MSLSANPTSTAEEVVSAEVKVCTCRDHHTLTPEARALAQEMYKLVTMGNDAYLHLLPRVQDNEAGGNPETGSAIKTDITAAMCYYEKLTGKIRQYLTEDGTEPREESMMAKMAARAGIRMNAAKDQTNSHITQMLVEGCTMSVTNVTSLINRNRGKDGCGELIELCEDWIHFEQRHMDALKKYL